MRVNGQEANDIQIDDSMHWGSMMKSNTALLAGVLIDENVMSGFDVKLVDYLTTAERDAALAADARWGDVTLKQLLSMSSGLEDSNYFTVGAAGDIYDYNNTPMAGRNYLVGNIGQIALSADPGTAYSYSNAGYTLAGLIIERAWKEDTGDDKSYETLMHDKLFTPLGITTATLGPAGMDTANATGIPADVPSPVATGHNRGNSDPAEGVLKNQSVGLGYMDADNPHTIAPAGTWAMSMQDYLKLAIVHAQTDASSPLLAELGLSLTTIEEIRTPVIEVTNTPGYDGDFFALGWVLDPAKPEELIYLGSNVRWISEISIDVDLQNILIVASNSATSETTDMDHAIISELKHVPEPATVSLLMLGGLALRRRPRTRQGNGGRP